MPRTKEGARPDPRLVSSPKKAINKSKPKGKAVKVGKGVAKWSKEEIAVSKFAPHAPYVCMAMHLT